VFYALLAERPKQAHGRVRVLEVPEATRTSLTRSLLLVTEAAKRDLPAAARRLARFMDDPDGGHTPPPPAH
jgi:hypothetical protein